MSAFMHDAAHIDAIVHAAVNRRGGVAWAVPGSDRAQRPQLVINSLTDIQKAVMDACLTEGEHQPGQDHRWQECPVYHEDEE